jgi:glycosyltransferase involved in cell wall biosynthesis
MKVLFVAYHDPYDIDASSGTDYHYLQAIKKFGFTVKTIGPFPVRPVWPERILIRLYQRTSKRYMKYSFTAARVASNATNQAVNEWKPDVVFTVFPPPLVFYHGSAPSIIRIDSTYFGMESIYPLYGPVALRLTMWQEKRAFQKSSVVITHSTWSKNVLIDSYKVPADRIEVYSQVSTLPSGAIPKKVDIPKWKALDGPIRLLLVGRDYRRKGVDIAMEVVHKLNEMGIRSELTVCGLQGKSDEFVHFVGPYKKSDPNELEQYVSLHRQAHFLIHPARFEAAGIVPGETAAFGTPTITNDAGGLATTVMNGESGIVLPRCSPAEAYVTVINQLCSQPQAYFDLCQRTRNRYERELNWEFAGKRLEEIFQRVVKENPRGQVASQVD